MSSKRLYPYNKYNVSDEWIIDLKQLLMPKYLALHNALQDLKINETKCAIGYDMIGLNLFRSQMLYSIELRSIIMGVKNKQGNSN
jgi:hypothetical protein